MTIPFIDLKTQYQRYKSEIDTAMKEVMDSCHFIMGPQVGELETKLAEYVGTQHCITVSSGTDSLMIALMALGIGPGDEVITVPFTWISTAEVIGLVGATPVFVDIEPDTYNMDVTKLEAAITDKTRAIMPVSLFGQMCDMESILEIADSRGIPVIEDAAQSFGAERNGKKSCGVGQIGSTSFFPAKPFGCYGDGGALFTSDEKLATKMRAIRTHGGERRHHHPYLGLNGRFDTLQAAVLLAKLGHYPDEVEARRRIGKRYNEELQSVCPVPEPADGNTHVYAQYTIRVQERSEVQKRLKEDGIPSAIYYPKCLHLQPVFADLGYGEGSFPVAEAASEEVLSLPMHPFLSEQDQEKIVDAVRSATLQPVGA